MKIMKLRIFIFILILACLTSCEALGYTAENMIPPPPDRTSPQNEPAEAAPPETYPDEIEIDSEIETAPVLSADTIGKVMRLSKPADYADTLAHPEHYADGFLSVSGSVAQILEDGDTLLVFLEEADAPANVWVLAYLPTSDPGYSPKKGDRITAYGSFYEIMEYPEMDGSTARLPVLTAFHIELSTLSAPVPAEEPDPSETTLEEWFALVEARTTRSLSEPEERVEGETTFDEWIEAHAGNSVVQWYTVNTSTKTIHAKDSCSAAKRISPENIDYTDDPAALLADGYSWCGICH